MESAQQRRLEAAETEKLREYTDSNYEIILEAARTGKLREEEDPNLVIITARVGRAKIHVEQHETLLQWIKQQLPLITSESAVSSHRNGNKEPALNLTPSDSKLYISGISGR